jgi:hypothetical protein
LSVDIPNDSQLISFGPGAFTCCESLQQIIIPNRVESLEDYCFHKCTNLASVIFQKKSNVTLIGVGAFWLASLQEISIPTSVKILGVRCFAECKDLISVVFEWGSQLASIRDEDPRMIRPIPKTEQELRQLCFDGCQNLSNLAFQISPQAELAKYEDFLAAMPLSRKIRRFFGGS